LIGTDDLATSSSTHGPVHLETNAVLDESHRAIGEREIGTARMQTVKSDLAKILKEGV
jgi:hypothetical protein